jgi:polyphosphate kinase
MPRLRHLWFDKFRNGFDAIRERDVLLYYPYHTFTVTFLPLWAAWIIASMIRESLATR